MRRLRPDAAPAARTVPVDALGPAIETLRRAARGDLEARVPEPADPATAALGDATNALLDVVDAFVRESAAALAASADGRFHRTLLERGLPGAFRDGARRINQARDLMRASWEHARSEAQVRTEIVTQAVEVSQHVAAASTELGASAATLRETVRSGVGELDAAVQLVDLLGQSSARIEQAVVLIQDVAASTRLLALNATIEAARAGTHGRAFGVVAAEVKSLSDRVATSSADIAEQVARAQEPSRDVADAIARIADVIAAIDAEATGVAAAAGHGEGGLSRMAETLHADIGRFAV